MCLLCCLDGLLLAVFWGCEIWATTFFGLETCGLLFMRVMFVY